MHHDDVRTLGRIDRFIEDRITPQLYLQRAPLDVAVWEVPDEPVPFADAVAQPYVPVQPGYAWGRAWSTAWFRVRGQVPAQWMAPDGAPHPGTDVEILADLGFHRRQPGFQAEGMVWRPDGSIVKAVQPYNQHIPVQAGPIDLYIEAAANPPIMGAWPHDSFLPTPQGDKSTASPDPLYTLRDIDVALRSVPTWELLQDLWTLVGLVKELPSDSTRAATILAGLERMLDVLDPGDIHATAPAAREVLRPLLESPTTATTHQLYATGHAHIDSAWLWPIRETKRKCARTFSNQLALMDIYPWHIFSCSSAQQYAWIKETYPELYARIKEKVAEGRFIPVGSMWVESDTNMPGGEALARQLVAGKRFFAEEFGIDTQEVWLPDSFGYTGAFPQLARLAGCRWFLTQKLSWNDSDPMPHHTFWWEGIDGSRVFTHFPPVDTYNSDLSAVELARAERTFKEKGKATRSLVPFGWGDGGGGATREMIAAAERKQNLEGSPRLRIAPPAQFFADAEAEYPDAPVWQGEMYLEFHRGTYTSQAGTKAGNRRSEHLLREAELWAATAAVQTGAPYPYKELEELWHIVLLHQFHDILPGSSIGWVHRQAEQTYAEVATRLEAIIADAARQLTGEGDTELLLNAAPHLRSDVEALGIAAPHGPSGMQVSVQREPGGGVGLSNGLVSLTIAADGTFTSVLDVAAGRELLAQGTRGNVLRLHRDQPRAWDAWDLDREYRRVATELTEVSALEVEGAGDSATVRITRRFGDSHLTQAVTLRRGSAAIEIVCDIDWHEQEKLLKLAFPLDVHAERAAYETQFGHVWRSTHANTSWDAAKFEACAHRWVYVAEPGYGVGIANSATYGHDITHVGAEGRGYTSVGLSLLRSPRFPDPHADAGRHVRTVVLHPGATLGETIEDGYRTNLAPRVVRGAHGAQPLVALDNPAVVIEAVKLAEDRSGDVIVRLYESLGGRATATLTPTFLTSAITEVDLLERPVPTPSGAVAVPASGGAQLALRPFQIVTLRLARA